MIRHYYILLHVITITSSMAIRSLLLLLQLDNIITITSAMMVL